MPFTVLSILPKYTEILMQMAPGVNTRKRDSDVEPNTVVVRYMADRLYGGLRIWRTIFGDFGRFLTIFGDFERFFSENIKFFRKKSIFYPKNPESAI